MIMSRLKRQRLSVDGQDRVTATGDDDVSAKIKEPLDKTESSQAKQQQGRSLFVRSLPASATTESLTNFFSQSFPLKHATVVVDSKTKQSKGYGFVTFADIEDAKSASETFNGSLFEGRKIKVELAEPRQRQAQGGKPDDHADIHVSTVVKAKAERGRHVQRPSKLIVRNLPWTIKDADHLAALFRSYGKVKHATVPKKGPGLSAGFGFVVIRGQKNAERALEGVNGKEIEGRTLAVDWAVQKEVWESSQQGGTRPESEKSAEGESVKSEDSDDVHVDDVPQSDAEHIAASDDDQEEDSYDGDEDDKDIGHEPSEKPDGNTSVLFIRNLPFIATDESLQEHFASFGPVRYARVVLDQATERSKGTGFVCFYNQEDADGCLREAPKIQVPAGQPGSSNKSSAVSSNKQSLLEDISVDRSGRFTLDGRVLQVSRAVDRKEATRLTFANSNIRDVRDKDRRRLYLLSEGTVPSNSPIYDTLSQSEIKMREDSAKQRQSLIKSNPTLHLSLTRLSVRNLPRSTTSKNLKALAREAVVGFAKDVKAGVRRQLSKEELSRGGEEMQEAERARKSKGKGIVKQAKIVFEGREGGKVAEDSGAGRSRGYGFIEYSSHRWALMGLRWLNGHAVEPANNFPAKAAPGKNVTERKKRLIIEFAIENAQVVGRRQEREAKARERSKLVTEKREKGEMPAKKKDFSKDQLMAKTRKGSKRKRGSDKDDMGTAGIEGEVSQEPDKLARRQTIIGRKRMMRKARHQARSS